MNMQSQRGRLWSILIRTSEGLHASPDYDIVQCSRRAETPRCILHLAHVRGRDAVLEQSRFLDCRHHVFAALEVDIADGVLSGGRGASKGAMGQWKDVGTRLAR